MIYLNSEYSQFKMFAYPINFYLPALAPGFISDVNIATNILLFPSLELSFNHHSI